MTAPDKQNRAAELVALAEPVAWLDPIRGLSWLVDRMKVAPGTKFYAAPPAPALASEPDTRAICEALGFDPTNHHNAAKCPYCRPAAAPAQAAAVPEATAPHFKCDVCDWHGTQLGVRHPNCGHMAWPTNEAPPSRLSDRKAGERA